MSDAKTVAVVGCGHWGKNLVRNFSELGVLRVVADADRAAAEKYATQFDVLAKEWSEVLTDGNVDAVVLATPPVSHAAMAQEALNAGKHVFVEKPLALRVDDALKTLAIARATERTLMVGHLLQYHPVFLRLREMVNAGELGRLQYVYSNRLNLGKIRREEDVFWSFAPHDLSMILALVGEEPTDVWARGSSYLHETIADVTTTHLSFPSGVNAHVHVSWLHPFKEQKLVVVGDGGMAVFDDSLPWKEKLKFYAHAITWREGLPEPQKADPELIEVETAEPLRLECAHFLECVATGRTPRTDGAEGLRVLRILEKSARSARGEEVATIASAAPSSPVSEQILGRDVFLHESSFVDDSCQIGAGTKIWHFSHILSGSVIGRDCVIGQNVMIGPDVSVGDRCKIQNNVSLYTGVRLGDGVFCGPSCVFTNVMNPRSDVSRKDEFRDTPVGDGTTIGANATIVCGNKLGRYSFVAAGAVVTKPVPDYALVAGVPARRIGWMSESGERLGDDLVCSRNGDQYELDGEDCLALIGGGPAGKETSE